MKCNVRPTATHDKKQHRRFLFLNMVKSKLDLFQDIKKTRKVSLMIHSARPTASPVATIVFCSSVLLDLKRGDGRTDGQHVRK